MEEKKELMPADHSVTWDMDTPAVEIEINAFWKKLRHFYRTGEKEKDGSEKLNSVLSVLLKDTKSNYPFSPDNKEVSFDFDAKVPFHMLNFILTTYEKENREKFKKQISELIHGLNRLLKIDESGSESKGLKETYNFADALIAFDKMVELTRKGSHVPLSDERLNRLKLVASTLNAGISYFSEEVATVIVDKDYKKYISSNHLFENAELLEAEKDAFNQLHQLFSVRIRSFTELIKAYRIATLEVEGAYKPEIHDEHFEHFTWHRLFDEELGLFHPMVLVVKHAYVFDHLTSFSRLLSFNQPVNILVCNEEFVTKPNQRVSWEDASHQYRQELAPLVIAQRNVYTFQTGIDDPSLLYSGLENCIKSIAPGVCHLSMPEITPPMESNGCISTTLAASICRYFPKILYNPNRGKAWGRRFDLSMNFASNEKWPVFSLALTSREDSKTSIEVACTYADYKAIFPEKVNELMLVPSTCYTEDLVYLSDYLELDEENLYGKIPYILLIDDQDKLHRTAVPNVWVVSCQERLDFWNFLQELGGISGSIKESIVSKDELQKEIEETKSKLISAHEQVIARIRKDAVGQATKQLIFALLDDNNVPIEITQKEPSNS